MELSWVRWIEENSIWAIWGTFVVGVITMIIVWKVRPLINYIAYGSKWTVKRINDEKIRIKGLIAIASPVNVIGTGTLRLNKSEIILKMITIDSMGTDLGTYNIELDGEYKGSYTGNGLLKLKITSMNKSKRFKHSIPIIIPNSIILNTDIINPLGHSQTEHK